MKCSVQGAHSVGCRVGKEPRGRFEVLLHLQVCGFDSKVSGLGFRFQIFGFRANDSAFGAKGNLEGRFEVLLHLQAPRLNRLVPRLQLRRELVQRLVFRI